MISACAMHQDEIAFLGWVSLDQRVEKLFAGDRDVWHSVLSQTLD
jgi:hypothetical protein